jgi:hypothetical protein
MAEPTKSKTSPKSGKKGCLCPDGKYSSECCNGDLQNQGIGSDQANATNVVIRSSSERTITN